MSDFLQPERTAPAFSAPLATKQLDMEALKAAVSSAVLQMGHDKTTVLHDEEVAKQRKTNGPLALMLDYGEDEEDDEDDNENDDADGPDQGRVRDSQGDRDSSISSRGARAVTASTSQSDHSMNPDDPLASFLDDLSSQGLLDDQQDSAGTDALADQPSDQSSIGQTIIQWLTDSWALVEDSGSTAVYYWNQQTNEVSWELPEGLPPPAASSSEAHAARATLAHGNRSDTNESGPAASAYAVVESSSAALNGPARPSADADVSSGTCTGEPQHEHTQPATTIPSSTPPDDTAQPVDSVERLRQATSADAPVASSGLPAGWTQLVDEISGLPYYWHAESNTTQWEDPAGIATPAQASLDAGLPADGTQEAVVISVVDSSTAEATAAVSSSGDAGEACGQPGSAAVAISAGCRGGDAAEHGAAAGARASAPKRGAAAAHATLAHARASAALSEALLAPAAAAAALRAELLVRQADLAALRGVIRSASVTSELAGDSMLEGGGGEERAAAPGSELGPPALSLDGVAAVCRHIELHVRSVLARSAEPGAADAVGSGASEVEAGAQDGSGGVNGNSEGDEAAAAEAAGEVEDGEVVPALRAAESEGASAGACARPGAAASAAGGPHGRGDGVLTKYMHETCAVSPWAQALHSAMHAAGTAASVEVPPPLPEDPPPEDPPPGLEEEHAMMEAAAGGLVGAADAATGAAAPPLPQEGGTPPVSPPAATAGQPEHAAVGGGGGVATGGDGGGAVAAAAEDAIPRKRRRAAGDSSAAGTSANAGARKQKKLKGRTSKLLNKWHNVARELEADEAARQRPVDLEARDRVRAADVEEWIADQFRTGAAQSNPNFLPLPGDWRERVRERTAARSAAAAAATAAADAAADKANALFFESEPDLEVLSVGLPEGWRALWDPSSKGVYYGNVDTKVSSWTRPI